MLNTKIKQAIAKWNDSNPTLRKKTAESLSIEIGAGKQYIFHLCKHRYKNIQILDFVFDSDTEAKIQANWDLVKNDTLTLRYIEKIRLALGCEITDLFNKK